MTSLSKIKIYVARIAGKIGEILFLAIIICCTCTCIDDSRDPHRFRSGLSTVPGNAKVHYNYANFLKDSSRIQEAVHHYQESLRLAPDHAMSHNNLGTLLDGREAELHFREAVKYNPQHYKAFYNLARNLE